MDAEGSGAGAMTPTFVGRLQTRLLLIVLVGVPWTILVGPFLPRAPGGDLGGIYATTFQALLIMAILGCLIWEPIYHLLQQFRWEKDWPILFGLGTVLNEAMLLWPTLSPDPAATGSTFVAHVGSTWVVMWLVANGPIRVFLLRWRFRGGKIVEGQSW